MKHVYLQSDERPLWTQAVDNKSLSARLGIKQSAPLRFASDDPWHGIRTWNNFNICLDLHATKLKLFVCFLNNAMEKMGKMFLPVAVSGHLWRCASDSQRCCLSRARFLFREFCFIFNFRSWHQQFVALLASVSPTSCVEPLSTGSVNPFVLAQQSCSEVFLLLDKQFQSCEGGCEMCFYRVLSMQWQCFLKLSCSTFHPLDVTARNGNIGCDWPLSFFIKPGRLDG